MFSSVKLASTTFVPNSEVKQKSDYPRDMKRLKELRKESISRLLINSKCTALVTLQDAENVFHEYRHFECNKWRKVQSHRNHYQKIIGLSYGCLLLNGKCFVIYISGSANGLSKHRVSRAKFVI